MNESTAKRPVIVGLFVFLGLTFLIAGILMVGNLRGAFTKKMQITGIFDDVNGLQVGNNVWFSGVKVGNVKTVDIFNKSRVIVVLNIDKSAQQYIRKDAKVKISSDGFIGNKLVMVYGGSSQAAPIQDDDTLMVEKSLSTEEIMSTFQENNKNVLAITNDFKVISHKLANGEGTIGKILKDETVYDNISATTASLKNATAKAQKITASLASFTDKLNKKGTLAHDLTTDTTVFKSMKASIEQLQHVSDTATLIAHNLKVASENPNSPVGVLLHDEATGAQLKAMMKNLESSSVKLDQDLEALQHNFLLRGYFRKQAKKKANP